MKFRIVGCYVCAGDYNSDSSGIFRFEIFSLTFAFDQTKIRRSPTPVFYVKHAANRGYTEKERQIRITRFS